MIVEPKVRGFICTTAHPQGCAAHVESQIKYVHEQKKIEGPKKVLVIGSSTGYGLASRITSAFGAGASTIGVAFEKGAEGSRTATAGWYNTAAFENEALKKGLYAKTIIGDAFSNEIKKETIDLIKKDLGKVDCVVYSLASPRRVHPISGKAYTSTLKPIEKEYSEKSINPMTGEITRVTIQPANQEEIDNTVTVMGGEDWNMWMDALQAADALTDNVTTIAYSYVGPELTFPIYRAGTIGTAKSHLEETAKQLHEKLSKKGGRAYVSVNKALVTQSSAAIPVVPLYISLLFSVMKKKNLHEDCIEQTTRLFADKLYSHKPMELDAQKLIRLDDWEMKPEVQKEVADLWTKVTSENILQISDLAGYRNDFYKLFGFGLPDVDYSKDCDVNVFIPSLTSSRP